MSDPRSTTGSLGSSPGLLIVGNHLSSSTMTRTVSEDLAIRLAKTGSTVRCTSSQPRALLRLGDMLWTTMRARNRYQLALIDVFSGRAFRYAEAVTALLGPLRRPIILTLHGGDLPNFAASHTKRVRRLFDRAAAITSPSLYLAESLSEFASVEVLPNPIDCSKFSGRREPTEVPHRIVWLRAFHRIYRPWDAVEAFALVVRRFPESRLRMIGPDKGDGTLDRVRSVVEQLGLQSSVNIVSPGVHHTEVPAALSQADIFLNTTAVDNTPISVLEAMASGLPVVSSNAGGLPYLLDQNRTALLTEVGAVDQLAASLCRLIEDRSLYKTLQTNGLKLAAAHDWSAVLPLWQQLIQRVASDS